jgi:hypothetical protein
MEKNRLTFKKHAKIMASPVPLLFWGELQEEYLLLFHRPVRLDSISLLSHRDLTI